MMLDSFDVHFLDPRDVRFYRGEGGTLSVDLQGETHAEVTLTRTFPLSRPSTYVAVGKPEGGEIGILRDLAELDEASQREAENELRFRYLVPLVTHIERIRQEPGLWVWDLGTDRGPMTLIMRNLHEHVQFATANRLLISDLDGRRCEIRDIQALDAPSFQQLRKIL